MRLYQAHCADALLFRYLLWRISFMGGTGMPADSSHHRVWLNICRMKAGIRHLLLAYPRAGQAMAK